MRVEPITVGCFSHCLKRGGRGAPIVRDEKDRRRFLRSLYYLNDIFFDEDWCDTVSDSQTIDSGMFRRAPEWPVREPLVKIICFTLMPNHVHLLLKEVRESGTSMFMKKLGQSMTNYFNLKYKTTGSIFQGAYKGRTVATDSYLRYLAVYIMVKNTFELFPGGLETSAKNFEGAWQFAVAYPFGSLGDYMAQRNFPIIDKDILGEISKDPRNFKSFAREVIEGGRWEKDKNVRQLTME